MALIDIIPHTKRGEAGCTIIIDAANLQAWTEANAERLVAEGYVRLVVIDHVATVAFGDKRRKR
jgi:hypothetical protein